MRFMNNDGTVVEIAQDEQKWLDDDFLAKEQSKLPMGSPRAALTYRVSTKQQVDISDDIPMQKIACRKFAQEHGWRIVSETLEKGISGSKVSAAKRDVIQGLRAEAEQGKFDIRLVYIFDRLGRIESETPFVVEWFINKGIEVWSTHEGQQRIDSHSDKLINFIRYWQAAGESEKTSIRTRDRLRQIVSSGHFTGGVVPYGYQLVDQGRTNKRGQAVFDLAIEPCEAAVVQEVFEKIAYEGYTCYRITKMLNDRGLKTHKGARWQVNNIQRMVRHEGYTGYILNKNARSEHIPELQIVDEKIWKRAVEIVEQARAKSQEKRKLPLRTDTELLLVGNLYCGCCGTRMSGFYQRDSYKRKDGTRVEYGQMKYYCYAKGQKVRPCDGQQLYKAETVDAIVEEVARSIFREFKNSPPRDNALESQAKRKQKQLQEQENLLKNKIRQTTALLERYDAELAKCLIGESSFDEATLARVLRRTEETLQQQKSELHRVQESMHAQKDQAAEARDFYDEFAGWVEEYDQATLKRRRMILSRLFNRIEVSRGYEVKIEINMSYKQFLQLDQPKKTK